MTKRKAFYFLCIAFLVLLAAFPGRALVGARSGLSAFLQNVLPALLPFYVGTSILVKSGVASRITKYLSFLMKPLFGLPGESAFAFFMAAISGYPMGARLTAELYEAGRLTRPQAVGTAILSSCCGPSFMVGAVAAGMLLSPSAGLIIACAHYLAMITIGIFYRPFLTLSPQPSRREPPKQKKQEHPSLTGIVMDSIASSAVALWSVGSYLIFFSALISIINSFGILSTLGNVLAPAFRLLGISPNLAPAILSGAIEMTGGCVDAASALAPLSSKVLACTFIITFGGLSVAGQSLFYLRKTGVRLSTFLLAKLSGGILSVLFASILLSIVPLDVETMAPILSFQQVMGANATLLIAGVVFLSFIGAAMSLYNMRNQRKKPTKGKQ